MRSGHYLTSTELKSLSDNRNFEVDYAYMCMSGVRETSYELVLGEAKGFKELKERDIEQMRALADSFSVKPYLAFSTLKDEFTEAEKVMLRALVADGYSVIALTREELDPYDLYDRFDALANKYAVTLKQFSESNASSEHG